MSLMPDGNTAALRAHEAAQDRADSLHARYGDRVSRAIVDKVFDGDKVPGISLEDLAYERLDHEWLCQLLRSDRDTQISLIDTLKEQIEEEILKWCDGEGAWYVAELEREWAEDDRIQAGER